MIILSVLSSRSQQEKGLMSKYSIVIIPPFGKGGVRGDLTHQLDC